MARIAVFIGTRPEGIKMAPVVTALRQARGLEPIVISTGQHRQMLQQVFEVFDITADEDLAVMTDNQTLSALTARLMTAVDAILEQTHPEMALVQGDTTTVCTTALCCYYRNIPVGHVEAGLRSGDMRSPFPEEANRKLTGVLATLHFAPTELGRQNLLHEGVGDEQITVTGNTVIDALQMEVARQRQGETHQVIHRTLAHLIAEDWHQVPFVLITGHRRENFGQGFHQICEAIAQLAQRFKNHRFIYPVHLNPNVQKPVYDRLGQLSNVKLIDPTDYRLFVALMRHCKIILTDSGGVQEEAPSLGKPVLVMRDTTERPEGITAGTARLVGASRDGIIESVSQLLTSPQRFRQMAEARNPYGDGRAAERIVSQIAKHLL